MRTDADREVVVAPPIREVVPALVAGAREVADLVALQSVRGEVRRDRFEHRGLEVVVRWLAGAPRDHSAERCLRLHRERVGREVRQAACHQRVEVAPERVHVLPGRAEEQVRRRARQAPRGHHLAQRARGGQRTRGVVDAVERAQAVVFRGLHAERDTVDADSGVVVEVAGLGSARVGLQRDLGVRRDAAPRVEPTQHCADRTGTPERGRAAAEEDRRNRRGRQLPGA